MSSSKLVLHLVCGAMLLSVAAQAQASSVGAVSTDRFGYTGIVKRYATLGDAQSGANQVGSDIAIGDRDLSIYVVNNLPAYNADTNIIVGSWWYTTEGSAGYGNVRGNSGRGFLQLYDETSETDTSLDMHFEDFDGTHWNTFALAISGAGAGPESFARFWVDFQGNGADKVIYEEYTLTLKAGGLQGQDNGTGLVEAFNHPTSVIGAYSGTFQNVSETYPQNNGFYTFDLALDMNNWAFSQEPNLNGTYEGLPVHDNGNIFPSYFAAEETAAVPEPGTLFLLGSGLLGLAGAARRRLRN